MKPELNQSQIDNPNNPENDYGKFGNQLHAGDCANPSEYAKEHDMVKVWHTDSKGLYWCGNWYHRTPRELLDECTSTIRDLILNHPDLINRG
jgi:hypothetical protein